MTTQPLHSTPSLGGRTPGIPPVIACTRFNNKTWQEYQTWLSAYQQSYEHIYKRPLKCIYGAPREISRKKIQPQTKILVIEMNNDENKIMGIGEIQNQTASETYRSKQSRTATEAHTMKFNIFSDRNYSRYIYIGNTYYASREELERNHTEDAQYINNQLKSAIVQQQTPNDTAVWEQNPLKSLERLLFKGARHMKRGSGITRVGVPPGVPPPSDGKGVPPPSDGNYVR